MDQRLKIARVLVSICAAFLGLVPPIVDFSETHLLNPLWIGHARFHTMWLLATNAAVALIAITVLWRELMGSLRSSVLLGASLVAAILGGFFFATATQSAYDGALTDPNGVAITVGPLDANASMFSLLACMVIAAFVLTRESD